MSDAAARFTLRQLSCFVAACEHGGLGTAAERLHLAQATVSASLADLERTLGAQLLVRGPGRAGTPSPSGRVLLADARAVLAAAARLEQRSAELVDGVAARLALGCLVTLAPIVAPPVCRAFERRFPGSEVELRTGDQAELVAALRDGSIELALTYDLGLEGDVSFDQLAPAPPYALFAHRHRFARRKRVMLAELAPEPLVLLDLPLSRDYFLGLFAADDLSPTIARRVADIELARSLVAREYGYTLGNARPAPTQAVDGAPLSAVPLGGAVACPAIGIARSRELRPTRTTAAFAAVCAELLGASAAERHPVR